MTKYQVFVRLEYGQEYVVEAEGPEEAYVIAEEKLMADIKSGYGYLDCDLDCEYVEEVND